MKHELQPCAVFVLGRRLAVVSRNGIGAIHRGGGVPSAHYIIYSGLDEGRSGLVVMTEIIIWELFNMAIGAEVWQKST